LCSQCNEIYDSDNEGQHIDDTHLEELSKHNFTDSDVGDNFCEGCFDNLYWRGIRKKKDSASEYEGKKTEDTGLTSNPKTRNGE